MEEEKELNNENENKGKMSKKTKIAIGAVAGVAAVSAIVIPTAVVLSNNSNSDKPRVYVDYNIDGLKDEHLEIEENMKISDLKLKPVEGYTFIGWYKDEECTEPYLSDDAITADSTIYAKYQLAMYMVTFPTGEHFSIDQESQAINYGDEVTFTITYEEGYDNNLQNAVVKANDQVLTPVSEGTYVLSGIKENTVVTIDGVEINKYTATINIDGEIKTATVEYGQKIEDVEGLGLSEENTIGFYTKEEFAKENLYDATLPISSDLTLYTKMATPDAFTYSDKYYGYSASINEGAIDAVMPLKHDGNLLTLVGGRSSTINSVYLTPFINEITDGAFQNCSTLKNINLENVVNIGQSAFEGCEGLNVDFTKLTKLQSVGESAFAMTGITEVRFSDQNSNIIISSNAFNGCEKLERVYIDQNVEIFSGGSNVFANCPNLSYIYWNNNRIQYSNYFNFSGSCDNVDGGATLVIGADVTTLELQNNFTVNDLYGTGIPAIITKLIFESDNTNNAININNPGYSNDREHPPTFEDENIVLYYLEEITIDSQRALNALLRNYNIFNQNYTFKLYVKDTLTDADKITYNYINEGNGIYAGASPLASIKLLETSDREGYLEYEITPYVEVQG